MKNRLAKIIIIFFILINCKLSLAQEQFEFNVTQIEVYENGTKFKGLKRGKISTDNKINLEANQFEYDKSTNILIANGNVIIKDLINDILIETENIIYKKNEEIIFTNSRSKATGKNTIINADSFKYNKNTNEYQRAFEEGRTQMGLSLMEGKSMANYSDGYHHALTQFSDFPPLSDLDEMVKFNGLLVRFNVFGELQTL